MTVTFMAMYENEENSKFDIDYYTNQHMPLVKKLWGSKLLNVKIVKGIGGLETPPKYQIIAILEVESESALHELIRTHGAELSSDFPNYSDVKPTIQISENVS